MSWRAFAAGACAAILAGLLGSGCIAPAPHSACGERVFEGSAFIVCAYDSRAQELRLAFELTDQANLRSFAALRSALGADADRLSFAMNAGMFNVEGDPIGLYVEEGHTLHTISLSDGPGNFHLKPNGVFWESRDGALHIEDSQAFAQSERAPRWATQSGPMLVIGGRLHPQFQPDGRSRVIRNGVGVTDERHAYFVISQGPVSFGRFARFFRDVLGCQDALFLDGGVSSLWAPALSRMDQAHPLGPLLAVLDE